LKEFHQESQNETEYPSSIAVDLQGNPYVTIATNGAGYFMNLKLSKTNGSSMWQHNYNTGGYNAPVKILVDDNYNIYAASLMGQRTLVLKYSQQMVGIENNNNIAKDFSLEQNFPNPFNPSTTIKYTVGKQSKLKKTVYDIIGKEPAVIIN
jgi:hypothetical protein